MSDLTPHRPVPLEVEGPLVSTGMRRGLHSSTALVLAAIGILLALIAQSITASALGFLLLAGAVGLIGEIPHLLAVGEVRARSGKRTKANRFVVIRRDISPVRFYSYVITYAVLGGFSFLAACAILVQLISEYAK